MGRIRLVDEQKAPAEFQQMFKGMRERGLPILNLFRVMANSPQVGSNFLNLGSAILMKGVLPPVLRELAILRVGHLNRAVYEWTHHVRIGLRVGVRQAQIDALPEWERSGEFDDQERAVLRFTDEETLKIRVSDEAFASVRDFLGEEGTVELATAVGYYGMVCRVLETLGVELEK